MSALSDLDSPVNEIVNLRLEYRTQKHNVVLECGPSQVIDPLSNVSMFDLASYSAGAMTDSGGLHKEAFLIGTPCTTIRMETESPETLARGVNVLNFNVHDLGSITRHGVIEPNALASADGPAGERIVQLLVDLQPRAPI